MSEELLGNYESLRQSYEQLQTSFRNNVQVIGQLEDENSALRLELARSTTAFKQSIQTLQSQLHNLSAYSSALSKDMSSMRDSHERELQQMSDMLINKTKKEVQLMQTRHSEEARALKMEIDSVTEGNRKLTVESNRLMETVKELRNSLIAVQAINATLAEEKQSYVNKLQLHQEEIEGLRRSANEWEEMLRAKLKEVQKDKQNVEEQFGEYKLNAKEKVRKLKEEQGKKIMQMQEEKQQSLHNVLLESKQIKQRFESKYQEHKECVSELNHCRSELLKVESELERCKSAMERNKQEKSGKEYEGLMRLMEQDKLHHRNEIQLVTQEKREIKAELEEVRQKLSLSEKALERLKTELLNQCKLNDELQHKYHRKDSVKSDIDLSSYNSHMFESGQPPKPQVHYESGNNHASQMKRVAELQMENQQLKGVVAMMKNQMESTRRFIQEQKNIKQREMQIYNTECNYLKERIHSEKEQTLLIKDQNAQLKRELQHLRDRAIDNEAVQLKCSQLQAIRVELVAENRKQTEAISRLKEEIVAMERERNTLEDISADLRAEINQMNQINQVKEVEQRMFEIEDEREYRRTHVRNHHLLIAQQEVPEEKGRQTAKINRFSPAAVQKGTRKLHDLIRERKFLEISGQKATMEERKIDLRLKETESQKQMYQKIKKRTPPKHGESGGKSKRGLREGGLREGEDLREGVEAKPVRDY